MKKMKKYRKWATLLIVPALLILVSSSAFAQEAELICSDGAAEKGDTDTVTVSLNGVTDLGAVDLDLSFDPSVVQETDITWGDLGDPFSVTINNTTGMIEMNWIGLLGIDGDFDLCTITFEAVGDYDDCSDLVWDYTNIVYYATPDQIPRTETDGEFCVLEGPGPTPRPGPTVGGTGQMPNKPAILAPWIAGGTALAIGLGWFVLRRRKAQT